MSLEISVSGEVKNNNVSEITKHNSCVHVLKAFEKCNIEAKITPNISLVNGQLEEGCTIVMPKEYGNREKLSEIWNIVKTSPGNFKGQTNLLHSEYDCAHLKIDGIFQGCIFNYIKANFCPLR